MIFESFFPIKTSSILKVKQLADLTVTHSDTRQLQLSLSRGPDSSPLQDTIKIQITNLSLFFLPITEIFVEFTSSSRLVGDN